MNHKIQQSNAHELCRFYQESNNSICLIVKNNKEAKYIFNELSLYLNQEDINYFPENEILPYDHFSVPENILIERFKILNSVSIKKNILITTIKNLFELYPSIGFFSSINKFSNGDKLSIKDLESILSSLNYSKTNKIDGINQYSLRGGIADIFTPIYKYPLRIEIFDDQIESIRYFDPESQLSIKRLDHFNISHGNLPPLDEISIKLFKDNWRDYFQNNDERLCEIFQKLSSGINPEGSEIYLPLFLKSKSNFFELFSDYSFLKIDDDLCKSAYEYESFINQRFEDENIDNQRPILSPTDMFVSAEKVTNELTKINDFKINDSDHLDFSDFNDLLKNIKAYKNLKVILATSIRSEYEILLKQFLPNINEIININDALPGVNLINSSVVRPYYSKKNNLIVVHREFYIDSYVEEDKKNISVKSKQDKSLMFEEDDLVIHENYGLGRYKGLEVVTANNISNEYMKIIYLANESLYVPLRSIDLISKYHKNIELDNVLLDSLSSTKWIKNKEKASKRAYDHAAEILDVESRRQVAKSSVLRITDDELRTFNADFPYTETDDQIEAINSIRKDIGLIKPMNRVLCGDVGFGKTEVAMRAAYISVHSEKQVIILCPSTVLADQHYESFIERFKSFPINIKLLTRHSKTSIKKEIVEEFNSKNIDIIIGTHALFTSGIDFTNTGLLVVDEEHKFGIKQKDVIKSKQENIHILYLSATPIPRTMNFIFSGLKEFSFLHTPPKNRISIKSFLKVQSRQLIKEAISREKSRGGQCFIVQNDISKMKMLKDEINRLLPNLNIGIAHGKLNKKEISDVMTGFDIGELDILICTTIVEMGLDIPNANTILIIDSQNFGLSQLHQLRGRVGRSSKQGYCYFLIPIPDLSKIAKERLDSIIRLSTLGSGFFIAQEDLEIRGGGEMLGDKQSGHINSVGINLYLSMLKNALDKFKNNDEKELIQTEINFYDSSYISDSYLPSALERLKIYKSINNVKNISELNLISSNLSDRCGVLPEEAKNLISNAHLSLLIKNSGILKINSTSNKTSLLLSTKIKKEIFERILALVTNEPNNYSINKDNKFIINKEEGDHVKRREMVFSLLNEII